MNEIYGMNEIYDEDFRRNGHKYSQGLYAKRNADFADFLENYIPKDAVIFEGAAAEGDIAYHILKSGTRIPRYIASDFSEESLKLIKEHLAEFPQVRVENVELGVDSIDGFDMFICSSLEHIESDIELLYSLPKNTIIALILPNFDVPMHYRWFRTADDIWGRYSQIIELWEVKEYPFQGGKSKIAAPIRRWLYKNRYKWPIRDIGHTLGITFRGDKKKWFVVGRKI
jgi:hypothetical protein